MEVTLDEGDVVFTVENVGVGVPRALREKIFQPWVTLTGASETGVGLGLAISKAAIEDMGGEIGCEERSDGLEGAAFWFRFPKNGRNYGVVSQSRSGSFRLGSATPERKDTYVNNQLIASPRTRGSGRGKKLRRNNSLSRKKGVSEGEEEEEDGKRKLLRALNPFQNPYTSFMDALTSKKQTFFADVAAMMVALRHGQEIPTIAGLVICNISWMLSLGSFLLGHSLYGLLFSLCALGHYFATFFKEERLVVSSICGLHWVGIVCVFFICGCCCPTPKISLCTMQLFSSLLYPNFWHTTGVWIICFSTIVAMNLLTDCTGKTLETPSAIALDICFILVSTTCSIVYEEQWKIHEKLREQFICGLSQELRTPLHGVMCAAEVLLARDTLSDSERENVQTIMGCGQLLSSLVNNILDAGKSARQVEEKEEVKPFHARQVLSYTFL